MKKRLAGITTALLAGLLLAFGSTTTNQAQEAVVDFSDYEATMFWMLDQFFSEEVEDPTILFADLAEHGDPLYIAPMVDLARFVQDPAIRRAIYAALNTLIGEDLEPQWSEYLVWVSANDVALPAGYDAWKGHLFSTLIDPAFARFFDGVQDTAQINLVEAVWGGVVVDGIPSLINSPQISPEDAATEPYELSFVNPQTGQLDDFCRGDDCSYPADDEFVFGVYMNGDARAYPLRLLNWHEMFNDVIGHAPLHDAPGGEIVCNFRAPTTFAAIAAEQVDGTTYVQIAGESAGCPLLGWLDAPESLLWDDGLTWDDVADLLPGEDDALRLSEAVRGRVDGTPIMLAYCTLCGAGVLYDPTIPATTIDPDADPDAEVTLTFSSTGLLMRSNKLMYDRNTDTVWNAMTGEPAFGSLAGTGIQLDILPVVVTDWATWEEEHPDTSVLSLDTGFTRNYTNGAAYTDYFNDPNFIMFPVFQQDESVNENKEIVFTLVLDDIPKAYPLRLLIPEQVTNDTLAGRDIVLVSRESANREFFEPGGASVRAYERGEFTFSPGESMREVIDQNGDVWQVTENALVGPDGQTLERLGGHLAFWFGWYAFYPDTLVYQDAEME